MLMKKYDDYGNTALKPFVEILQLEYYDAINSLCTGTYKQCEKIKKIEKSGAQLQYVMQCEHILAEIEKHIKNRKDSYIPYVHELSEKVVDRHDCSTCTGKCSVNHDMRILELNATNEEMKRMLSRLQVITLPLYSETMYPDEYRLLRSNMTLLENNLTELFFLENNYLIPKIVEAQKTINASNK